MKSRSSTLTPLEQALVVRAIRTDRPDDKGVLVGAGLAALRGAVARGEHDAHEAASDVSAVERGIREIGLQEMPPQSDLVATLIETLAMRLGEDGSHAAAWRAIGVRPGRGRDLLARQAHAVDWPLWRTLRDAALDGQDIQVP